ncbi:OadG family protein [Mariniphaga sediminis]|jgi:Na+-transporting methylmalonyl-CoA/oxaloacetate decarboxylase gamma subunit|uniref:OadG family protein n=1 Tax=Mariniphaga sediminis TaxID=1628158 RepID=UPI0035646B7C
MELLFLLLAKALDFGFTVAIVGFGIVLTALTLLFIVFSRLPKIINLKFKKKKGIKEAEKNVKEADAHIEGNVTAAVSLAMHLYFNELHDEESNILTIKQVRKAYSPWSSKIYSVTQNWPKN